MGDAVRMLGLRTFSGLLVTALVHSAIRIKS